MVNEFEKAKKRYFEKLDLFVPVVDRVHGGTHPEFHEVRSLYETIREKTAAQGPEKPDLENEFRSLREITDSYTVPGDVCESYEAVYTMLADVDRAWQA